jgi:hypothetical protein
MAGRRHGSLLLMMLGCLAAACVLTGFRLPADPAGPGSTAQAAAIKAPAVHAPAAAEYPAADPSVDPGSTEGVATDAPTTEPPTSAQPTAPPTTAPVTTAPVTTAPVTTAPPTLPATSPAEQTQPVAPITPDSPTMTISPATGSSDSWLPWLLAGLGALVLLGLVIGFARASSRRDKTAAAWRSRRLNAYAEGAALHDAVMAAEGGPMQPNEAAARWADIQHRADNFNQRLYQLRETAPDEASQAHIDELLVSLQALRSALDAQRASRADWTASAATSLTAGVVRDRLNDFRILLSGLRDADPAGNRLAEILAGASSTAVRRSAAMTWS